MLQFIGGSVTWTCGHVHGLVPYYVIRFFSLSKAGRRAKRAIFEVNL